MSIPIYHITAHVLDWETIESDYWFNTENDPDRKRRNFDTMETS